MRKPYEQIASPPVNATVFPTTHWSVVLAAGQQHNPLAQEALARLCETYRSPLLAYAQALRLMPEDAEDATQAFFVHFLTHNLAGKLERHSDVKFRSYLFRCFRNFLSDERARRHVQWRGGGQPVQSLDDPAGAEGITWEPADEMTAARAYERRWATALLDHVLARLEGEY
ncbi:MAG: sigma-70 family RNA polymerase sigma factor, partial [Chloroflexi bacterium]|nr:sigma-70 family RNA polymerase sigma factor [Chloroflexota bacterium]